jgi:GxxExxY protein
MDVNDLTHGILGAAIEVHRRLGPGLLESTYQRCVEIELGRRGIGFQRQVSVPIRYRGVTLREAYRIDLLVEEAVIVELKAVAALDPIFSAQVLTYLRLAELPVGLLINFNVPVLKKGIRRLVLGAAPDVRGHAAVKGGVSVVHHGGTESAEEHGV